MPPLYRAELACLAVGWALFAAAFLAKRRTAGGTTRLRDPASFAGIAVQSASYALVSSWRRPVPGPLLRYGSSVEIVLAVAGMGLALTSPLLMGWAIRTLGRQWSLQARVLEDHTLVTSGPYALVRHPIYTAMGGMLLATGVALARPVALLAGVALFLIGTWMRTSREEALLRASFGGAFEAYARQVPWLLPRPWRAATGVEGPERGIEGP